MSTPDGIFNVDGELTPGAALMIRRVAEERLREEQYRSTLPARRQCVADEISALLPDGLRVEWVGLSDASD